MSQPVYIIGHFDVKDFAQYRDQYGRAVVAQFAEIGAELLVASRRAETLEGEWSGNYTVIIRFPSRETAVEWYESAKYAPFKKARMQELTSGGNLVLLPGRNSGSTR